MILVYRLTQIKFTKIILLKITNNNMISHEVIIILHNTISNLCKYFSFNTYKYIILYLPN